MSFLPPPILVTGASGKLGRRVVEILLEGETPVIAASRDPIRLAYLATRGADTRRIDFEDPHSLEAGFAGVRKALIISTDAIDSPGKRKAQQLAAVEAARKAGVEHIVYTSMPKPEPGSPIGFAPDHYETEQAIEASGADFTILRNAWYAENLQMSLPQILSSGKWVTSAGAGRVTHVTREDAARAAAAALASSNPEKARYDITGPKALTTAEIAAIAGKTLGRPIQVIDVSDDELRDGLNKAGLPPFLVELLVGFDANTRMDRIDIESDAVERLTGRKPQSLESYFAENKSAFV